MPAHGKDLMGKEKAGFRRAWGRMTGGDGAGAHSKALGLCWKYRGSFKGRRSWLQGRVSGAQSQPTRARDANL